MRLSRVNNTLNGVYQFQKHEKIIQGPESQFILKKIVYRALLLVEII